MKKSFILNVVAMLLVVSTLYILTSCKTASRAAARYWTNKQIREFISGCEDKSKFLLGESDAKKYCDCAVDVVSEKYRNYEDLKKTSLTDVLKIANDCK